jgi:3-oxocholest-4-en-26-oate---CoA ligase
MVAAFKAAMVPREHELPVRPRRDRYLFDNADAEAVVFHARFTELLDGIRGPEPHQGPRWYVVADDTGERPDVGRRRTRRWSTSGAEPVATGWGRSGDDLLLLYTGGTTGMPKGVMWRQDDLFNVLGAGGNPIAGVPPGTDVDEVVAHRPCAPTGLVHGDRLPADARHRPVLRADRHERAAARS